MKAKKRGRTKEVSWSTKVNLLLSVYTRVIPIKIMNAPLNENNLNWYYLKMQGSGFRIKQELEMPLGKVLIEENGCSIVEINKVA